jgi:hypothetical protein
MAGFLDTSVVVRYLTGDPPSLAAGPERCWTVTRSFG